MFCLNCGNETTTTHIKKCSMCNSISIFDTKLVRHTSVGFYYIIIWSLIVMWQIFTMQKVTYVIVIIVLLWVIYYYLIVPYEQWKQKKRIELLLNKIPNITKRQKIHWPNKIPSFIVADLTKLQNELRKSQQLPVKHIRKTIPLPVKEQIWRRDYGNRLDATCPICFRNNISVFQFHCGHIKSLAQGGDDKPANLRAICGPCNLSMGIEDMNDFQQRLWN